MMFDLKVLNSVLSELEEDRGIPRQRMLEAVGQALATAYKKEFGKKGQIITCNFNPETGTTEFNQVKIVVDESILKTEEDENEENNVNSEKTKNAKENDSSEEMVEKKVRFDEEKHIMLSNAKLIKKDVVVGEELVFPLETKEDFGRIAAQTAKQVIMQKIREAEKESALAEFGQKAGEIVTGTVQRFERGRLYVDLGKVTAIMPYDEQIPGERFRTGDRIRALLLAVEETGRGVFLKLSRSHPDFLVALFKVEVPELQSGTVTIKGVAREAGSRSKIAVYASDPNIDPVGSLVGQRGVRVSTVMSELGGEKIDIIEWSEDNLEFIEDTLSPAQVVDIRVAKEPNPETGEQGHVIAEVTDDQQSLAIGRGGQNVRLAAKLTGWKIDIVSVRTGEDLAEADASGKVTIEAPLDTPIGEDLDTLNNEEATTTKPDLEKVLKEVEATKDRGINPDTDEIDEIDTPEEAEAEMADLPTEDNLSDTDSAKEEVAEIDVKVKKEEKTV